MTRSHQNATPLEAVIEHTAAFSSGDNDQYARILSIPFIHVWPDGKLLQYDNSESVDLLAHYKAAGLTDQNFDHTELDAAVAILDWPELKVFRVEFTRYGPHGMRAGKSEALWVVVRVDGGWKVKLRVGAMPAGGT